MFWEKKKYEEPKLSDLLYERITKLEERVYLLENPEEAEKKRIKGLEEKVREGGYIGYMGMKYYIEPAILSKYADEVADFYAKKAKEYKEQLKAKK